MGIISPLLQHEATRSSLQGMSAYGEVFDTSETIRCRIEPSSKRVSTEEWFSHLLMPFTFQNQYRKILKLINERN